MIQKLKLKLVMLATTLMFPLGLAMPVAVSAQDIQQGLCSGADLSTSITTDGCDDAIDQGGLQTTLNSVINIISVIVGVVAVIMIIFGGFRYITSGGDSTKVTNAKNTILYGLIGLIIVAVAQVLVKFVLNQVSENI